MSISRVCFFSLRVPILQILFLFLAIRCLQSLSACNYAQPETCGTLSIPYPFGISPECGLPQFRISCKPNASYGDGDLAFLQIGTPSTPELQVLEFATDTLVVNSTELKAMAPNHPDCNAYGDAALELSEKGPFILAQDNWFVVIGCRSEGTCNAKTTGDPSTISCTTGCYNQGDISFCNRYTCCINPLPPGSWSLGFQGKGISYADFPGVCGFSTVLSPSTYKSTQAGIFGSGHYGLSIAWALLSNQKCGTVEQSPDYACSKNAYCMGDGNYIQGYNCNCSQGYRGDGYKAGIGCQDIDECEEQTDECEKPPLGICINTEGSYNCSCTSGIGSGLLGTCTIPNSNKNVLLPALLGGLAGAASLAIVFVVACLSRRAYRKRKAREDNFKRVGGEQLTSFLFSERELVKATKGFSDDHCLGEGGFGKVYWGKLSKEQGNMRVAIKRAKAKAVEEQVEQIQSFVREILLLSKTLHKNVVRLLGCCVETSVPLLVYEFVEKGTLRDYLKPQGREIIFQGKMVRSGSSLMWAWRLQMAIETAEAIGYLHNLSEPIFHLDLKSTNILIDRHYNPKVADFGLSCFLTSDATHLTNQLPVGTFGYVDPEYYHSLRVTGKCDVYSFGVILLELISGMPAIQGPGAVLAHQFRTDIHMSKEIAKHVEHHPSFIDARLGTDADVLGCIRGVGELARRCVAEKGVDRPSMQEVVIELRQIQSKHAGKPYFDGWVGASLDRDYEGMHELYGVNSNESEGAAFLGYKGIPSDHSASSSSLFTRSQRRLGQSQSTSDSHTSRSTIIELGQFSKSR